MVKRRFEVGQIVEHDTRSTPNARPAGPYKIVRVLPSEEGRSQTYRVKSSREPFERSAKEYELILVDLNESSQT